MTATLPKALLTTAGGAQIEVQNGSVASNALPFTILSPGQKIAALIALLPGSGLDGGQITNLTNTLDAALTSIQKGDLAPAAFELLLFDVEVQLDTYTGKINAATSNELISGANAILATL
jgi:hypothetical protein